MEAYQYLDRQFIAGEWCEGRSNQVLHNIDPYTLSQIFEMKAASQQDVDAAYSAAQQAFEYHQHKPIAIQTVIKNLIGIIETRREEIIGWLIQESGSTRLKSNIEVDAALGIIRESLDFPNHFQDKQLDSADPTRESWVVRKPLGVIAVISPWNFPLHLSMRSVVTAIACGNAVVLKPASDTPVTGGTLLAKLFEEAGLPAGMLNVVVGSGREIGDYFVEHPTPKMISFTGSTEVGQRVGAKALMSSRIKRLALELGGNAPLVILDDADLDMAVALTIMGRFLHQGQICMSTNRVIVDQSIHDIYVDKLMKAVKRIVVGDPQQVETLIGPVINQAQVDKHRETIALAQQQGAILHYAGDIEGQLVGPHIFTHVDPESDLAQRESFGPILAIIQAKDEAEALYLANDTDYGLSAAVCTQNIERGMRFAQNIEAGMTHVNGISVADHANAPFGGEKNSGLGRFNGQWIFEEFTRTHWLTRPHSF